MRVKKLHGLGNHLTLDCFECDKSKLNNKRIIKDFLERLTKRIKMKAISKAFVKEYKAKEKEESGITGFILLAESHIAIHTYPNKGYAAVDIFSCKEFKINEAIDFLKNVIGARTIKKCLIRRGYDEKS